MILIRSEQDEPCSQIGQAIHAAEEAIDHIVELRDGVETRGEFSSMDRTSLRRLVYKLNEVLFIIATDRKTIEAQAAE